VNGAGELLEGVPVDASVQAGEEGTAGETAIEAIYAEVPTVNAPSEPVLSLAADVVSAPPAPTAVSARPVSEPIEESEAKPEAPQPAEATPAPQPVAAETRQPEPPATTSPARKGWWQRPFRSSE